MQPSETLTSKKFSGYERFTQIIKNRKCLKDRVLGSLLKSYYLMVSAGFGYGIQHPGGNFSIILKQLQLNFIVLDDGDEPGLIYLKPLMIHRFEFYSNYQDDFKNFCIFFCMSLVLMLFLLFFMVFFKRCLFRSWIVIAINVLTLVFYNFLMIGVYMSTSMNLKNSTETLMNFIPIQMILLLYFIPLVLHIVLFNTFSYRSSYKNQSHKSRSNSLFSIQQELGIFSMCLINSYTSHTYFLVLSSFISFYLSSQLFQSSPYYKHYQTLIESVFWVSIFTNSLINLLKHFIGLQISCFLIFLILIPAEYILCNFYLDKVSKVDISKDPSDPYELERQIRSIVFNGQKLDQQKIRIIQGKFIEGTKKFLEFKMIYIWEFNFLAMFLEDFNLAAVKLSKMPFSDHSPEGFQKNKVQFSYPFRLECDFFFYSYAKMIKQIDIGPEATSVKFNETLQKMKFFDYQICQTLISVLESFNSNSNENTKKITEIFLLFHEQTIEKNHFFEKSLKTYGFDRKLIDLHESFQNNLFSFKSENRATIYKSVKNNFLEKITGERRFLSQVTLGGCPKSFCKISQVNDYFISMLKYPNENILLGLKFQKLIPFQLWQPKKTLTKFLLYSYSDSFIHEKLFLFNFFGYLVEVNARFRATFVKGRCLFVVDMEERPDLSFVIFKQDGEIISKSEIFQSIIHKSMKNILELFSDLFMFLTPENEGKEMLYETFKDLYFITFHEIQGYKTTLILLYLRKEDKFFTFTSTLKGQTIQSERRKSMFFGEGFFEEKGNIGKPLIVGTREVAKQKEKLRLTQSSYSSQSKKIAQGVKILKIGFWVLISLQVFAYLGLIFYFEKYFEETTLTTALYDICSNRYHLSAIVMNLRSIDLLNHGFTVGRLFSEYNQSFYNSLNFTQYWLRTMQEYGDLYDLKDIFHEPLVDVFDVHDLKLVRRKENLFKAIYMFVERGFELMNGNFSDRDQILAQLKLGFYSLQKITNESAYISYKNIRNDASLMLTPCLLLNLFTLFPIFSSFFIFFLGFCILRQVNQNLWTYIQIKPSKIYLFLYKKLVERIRRLHDSQFQDKLDFTSNKSLSSLISKRFYIKLLIFSIFILIYFLVAHFFFYKNLEAILQMRIDFRFYAGLRSATIRSFSWAREAELHKSGAGYSDLFSDFHEIRNEKEMALIFLDEVNFLLGHTLEITTHLNSHYNYQDCLDYLIKESCSFLDSFENCSQTTLKFGSYHSQKIFIDEMKILIHGNGQDLGLAAKLEKGIKKLEASFSMIVTLFDLTKNDVKMIRKIVRNSAVGMIFLVVGFGLGVLFIEIENVKKELVSRDEFLMQFEVQDHESTGKFTTLK